jgi:ABC-type Fe3+ transport system substrate-binding protein
VATTFTRRDLLKHTFVIAGALGVLAGCSSPSQPTGGGGAAAPTSAAGADDVQQAYDGFVKKEMPNVPVDLLRAAKQEGTLASYMLVPDFNKVLVDTFQKTFPFVKVQMTNLNGGALLNKFLSEARAGQNVADVVQPSSVSDAQQAINEQFVLNYQTTAESQINMAHGVPGYVIPVTGEILVIGYNPQKINDTDAAVLSKWEGLLDPRWNGKKFGVVEVQAGGTSQLLNYYFAKQFQDRMWKRVAESGYSIYPGGNPALDAVISGENDLAVGVPGSLAAGKLQTGAPLRWQNAQDWLVTPYVQFINAKAPHPNAAKLFQEFTLSPTGQQVFGSFGGISLRSGIKSDADFTKQSWYQAPDPAKVWPYSDQELGAAMPGITEQWRAIIK